MLDACPVALPPIPRPPKRSASTASLPTPPHTHHKRKHARSRGLSNSGSDSGSLTATDEDESSGNQNGKNKRRTSEDDEDAFWMGATSSRTQSTKPLTRSQSRSPSVSLSPPPLLYRRRQTNGAPVSPPPSRRKTTKTLTSSSTTPRHDPSVKSDVHGPVRDSPNNPFLASPVDLAGDANVKGNATAPRTPPREKPTVAYVFRGVRAEFANPLYDHKKNRPLSPSSTSLLPYDHPDYSPDPSCPPKLLFPGAGRLDATDRNATRRRHHHEQVSHGMTRRSRSASDNGSDSGEGDEDTEEEQESIKPMKLNFGDRSPRTREGTVGVKQLEKRDDPIRRAIGPLRR